MSLPRDRSPGLPGSAPSTDDFPPLPKTAEHQLLPDELAAARQEGDDIAQSLLLLNATAAAT